MEMTKTITMTQEMAIRIQELADRERRSFAREAQVLLEAALKQCESPRPSMKETGD
jgi:hypothetical protein